MSNWVKFLIGLAAALLLGFVWHGPLGNGATMIDALESQARAKVTESELPGITVGMARAPLARVATLSGEADDIQREGLGSGLGVKDYVRTVDGIAAVRWSDEPEAGGLPLLAETLIGTLIAFLIGLGLAWLFWSRRRRDSYL